MLKIGKVDEKEEEREVVKVKEWEVRDGEFGEGKGWKKKQAVKEGKDEQKKKEVVKEQLENIEIVVGREEEEVGKEGN